MASERADYRLNFSTILHQKCPTCGQGALFSSLFTMNDRCPECGLLFGRGQPGYFTGAMYVSYGLGIPIIALATLIEYYFLRRWSLWQLVLLSWVVCLPLFPWIWQYSRTIWVHLDQWIDPEGDHGAGPGSKMMH